MIWNPLQKIKEAWTGQETPRPVPLPKEGEGDKRAPNGGMPDMRELEKQGMLGKFFRHWKSPAFVTKLKALASRMQAEGVDIKDRKAVMAWVDAHKDEIESGQFKDAQPASAKPQTYVKTGPDVGRNDPCHCGSGKKFKKCHGAGA